MVDEAVVEVAVKRGPEREVPKFALWAKRFPPHVEVPVFEKLINPLKVWLSSRLARDLSATRVSSSENVSIEEEEIVLLRVVQLSTLKAFPVMRRPVPVKEVMESLPSLKEVPTLRAVVVASVVVLLPKMVKPEPRPALMVEEAADTKPWSKYHAFAVVEAAR